MRQLFALMVALALFTAPGFAGECMPEVPAGSFGSAFNHDVPIAQTASAGRAETLEPLALGFSETARAHRTGARGAGGFRLAGARYRDFDCPGGMPTCTL